MPKEYTDQEIKQLHKELDDQRKQAHETVIALMEVRNQLHWTQTELLKHLTGTSAGAPASQPKDQPPNYDSPDFDELLNKQIDEATITKGIASQVYHGRFVAIQLTGNGTIELRQQSHHQTQADSNYKPTRHTLSQETFFLVLEAMEYAEKKFGLDRKAILEKLTGGGKVQFKEAITLI